MKVNLMLFSLFLFVSIMACNVFAFSISGGGSEASYKETEKTSVMTTTLQNFSHHRRFCLR